VSGPLLLLTHEGPGARLLAARLQAQVGLAGILLQDLSQAAALRPSRRVLTAVGRLVGPQRLAGLRRLLRRVRMSRQERQLASAEEAWQRRAFDMLQAQTGREGRAWPAGVPLLRTADVHAAPTLAWCAALAPRLLLVFGGPLVRPPLLGLARHGAVNVHTSLLPEFRGNNPEFWQVHAGDFSHAGVTVHVIDAGVDTGDILAQWPLEVRPPMDPALLRAHGLLLAAKQVPLLVPALLAGPLEGRPQGPSSHRTFRSRDVTLAARLQVLRNSGPRGRG
jgi:methionyl-tRNA formyltransferase